MNRKASDAQKKYNVQYLIKYAGNNAQSHTRN